MGLFGKTISDKEWLGFVMPLYKAALPLTTALSKAVAKKSMEDQIRAISDVLSRIPVIATATKSSPSPSSPEARKAKKEFERALKLYVDAAKVGTRFFRDFTGGPGRRLHDSGIRARAAAFRLGQSESMFRKLTVEGTKHFEKATAFFSGRR